MMEAKLLLLVVMVCALIVFVAYLSYRVWILHDAVNNLWDHTREDFRTMEIATKALNTYLVKGIDRLNERSADLNTRLKKLEADID